MRPGTPIRRPDKGSKPFQPAVGTDFGAVEDVEARNRGFLLRAVVSIAAAAVITTGAYGLITGAFQGIIAVWAVAGPLVGAMVTHYFGPRRNDTG